MVFPIVNRNEQLQQIREALEQVQKGIPFTGLEYSGIGGQGKTSILEGAKALCRDENLPFAAIDFAGSSEAIPKNFLVYLCGQFEHYFPFDGARSLLTPLVRNEVPAGVGAAVHEPAPESPAIDEIMPAFHNHLLIALDDRPLILMLDSTERCPEALLDWIGNRFLAPLVTGDQPQISVVIFLAGRVPRVRESGWPSELLRRTEAHRLDPLDFPATEDHLEALPPEGQYRPAARQIYALTNGHPYSTESLVGYLRHFQVAAEEVEEHRQQMARRLHEEVIQRYILSHATTPADWALPLLELASIARKFDAGLLAHLDARYRPTVASERSVQWYTVRIANLVRPLNLARASGSKPPYELDRTLRRLLHTALVILDPERVVKIHKAVREIHEQELERISRPDELTVSLTVENLYHTAQVAAIEEAPVVSAVSQTLDVLLRQHFPAAEPTDTLQALKLLETLLDQDSDLLELLGRDGLEALREQIQQFAASPGLQVPFELSLLDIGHTPPSGYSISWYHANQVVVPSEIVRSALQFPQRRWREAPEATGKTAFGAYLPTRAQEFVRRHTEWAIQIVTNWTGVPWEMMHDDQEFLCLSRPIARKPRMVKEPRQHAEREGGQPRALVVGNPTGDLDGAQAEAEAVIELLQDRGVMVDSLLQEDATAADFATHLTVEKYDLIHYAGHSYFDPDDPRTSGLIFHDNPFYAEELERLLRSPAFIFFSSCEAGEIVTLQSKAGFRGEFMEGLASSALLGGASGCLGPMWPVADGMARDFALAFYDHLLRGQPIGEAVRQARLHTFEMGTDFWASWILYGDPLRQIEI